VFLPPAIVDALHENLAFRGLPQALACPAETPLLSQARAEQAISPDGIARIIKGIFASAAARIEAQTPEEARRLRQASTHWLRHTHSAHALAAGGGLAEVSEGLGHASVNTTALYLRQHEPRDLLGVESLVRKRAQAGKL
jgi:integrase